ncbi:hypothetical protein BafACA1_F33 (plasmid) [Borreliella afzelii ACA-1]|nr:hypothetical protein BafACA1_F33 [Borreliella afzelii ACA-1]
MQRILHSDYYLVKVSNRIITIVTVVVVPIAISTITAIVVSLITGFFK